MGGADGGAKFWLQVLTELQNRCVQDIFLPDGLKGFPEAIEAVYPRTEMQLLILMALGGQWYNVANTGST